MLEILETFSKITFKRTLTYLSVSPKKITERFFKFLEMLVCLLMILGSVFNFLALKIFYLSNIRRVTNAS